MTKEEKHLYNKQYNVSHPGYFHAYYLVQKDDPAFIIKSRQNSLAWHRNNPDAVKRDNEKFRAENPDYLRTWQKTPAGRACQTRVNHRRRALGEIDMTAFYLRCDLLVWKCQLCGKNLYPDTVSIDHIVPVSKGGTNDIENLQPLCLSCNHKKATKPMALMLQTMS